MSVDPLADQRSWVSPYNYVQNNPLNRVDPDGMLDNPIYGKDGNFLGTDDKGLEGRALVMNESDFTQGMSHQDALAKDVGLKGLNEGAIFNLVEHKSTLSEGGSSGFGDFVNRSMTNADATTTAVGGVGLNWKEVNRAGNHGNRFRARLFGTNIKLRGSLGSKVAAGVKVGGPLLSAGSIGLSLTSNQSTGFKIADTGSSLYGIFGGPAGALTSLGYSFGAKPFVRAVVSPTAVESRSLHEFQNRNSQSSYCRGLRCR